MTAWPLCSLSKRQLRPWQTRLPHPAGAERATHLLNLALNTDPSPRNAFDPPRLALTTQPRPVCFTVALPLASSIQEARTVPEMLHHASIAAQAFLSTVGSTSGRVVRLVIAAWGRRAGAGESAQHRLLFLQVRSGPARLVDRPTVTQLQRCGDAKQVHVVTWRQL
jgi:hypothetical protein